MAVQNMYNNYLKRQQQTPTNQFRQKVANSLGGKTVGNNTTQKKSPSMMGNTGVNTLGNGVQNKPTARTITQPITTQNPIQTPVTSSNVIQTPTQTITPLPTQNPSQSTTEPQNAISSPEQITLQQSQTNQDNTTPIEQSQATGMMSLSDIDNAINGNQNNTPIQTSNVARSGIARATAQEIAQESVETQKKALQEQWEQQKKELELQKQQTEASYNQSKVDAENTYKQSEEKLQESRYTQQENLAVSGQKRGIQYSPQQLALENVANINLNKNLAEASKSRNELLNNLAIQLGQSLATINTGLQGATVSYNTNVSNLMAEYQKQMANWAYTDQQTESDRTWQEKQTQANNDFEKQMAEYQNSWQQSQTEADRNWQTSQSQTENAFEKEMAEYQNKWQSGENALDRTQYGKSSSGYSGYSYSGGSSYTPYSSNYSSNYTPYTSKYSDDLDLSSKEGSTGYLSTVKDSSTALYNALSSDPFYDINERGQIYIDEMDQAIDYAKKNGADSATIEELQKTRKSATVNLYKKYYGQNTNTEYQLGDTVYKSDYPLDPKKVAETKKNALTNASKYNAIVGKTNLERNASSSLAKTMEGIKKGTIKKAKNTVVENHVPKKDIKSSSAIPKKTLTSTKVTPKSTPKSTAKKASTSSGLSKDYVALKSKSKVDISSAKSKKTTNLASDLKKAISNLFSKKKKK